MKTVTMPNEQLPEPYLKLSPKLKAAIAEVVEVLARYEAAVPQTECWLADTNKAEITFGALRRLKKAAGL